MNDSYEMCRVLYRAARSAESSSEGDRRAVRKALAAAVAAGVTATTAGISGAAVAGTGIGGGAASASPVAGLGVLHALVGGKVLSSLIIGAALGSALSTTVFVVAPALRSSAVGASPSAPSMELARPHHAPPSTPESPVWSTSPPLAVAVSAGETPAAVASVPTAAAQPRVLTRVKGPTLAAQPGLDLPSGDGLAEEAQGLTEVHHALGRRDANLAWSLLQEQNRRFPLGQLGEERAAAKVMALCALGRYSEADIAQVEFARSYPNSPLAKRVKKGCER